jgi:hypothetical protein
MRGSRKSSWTAKVLFKHLHEGTKENYKNLVRIDGQQLEFKEHMYKCKVDKFPMSKFPAHLRNVEGK